LKISEVLSKERIIINIDWKNKYDVLENLVKVFKASDKVTDETDLIKKVIEREKIKSTGIGGGIGIPHAQSPCVKDVVACLCTSIQGIDFDAVDGKPVNLVFLIVTSEKTNNIYLGLLSRIARLLVDETFKQKIINSNSPDEILNLISEKEKD